MATNSGATSASSPYNLPSYFALSYTWNSSEYDDLLVRGSRVPMDDPLRTTHAVRHPLWCRGRRLLISTSLRDALRRLRQPYTSAKLWADAVCINQAKDEERSMQILFMQEIYHRASQAGLWLGNGLNGAESAIDLLEALADRDDEDLPVPGHIADDDALSECGLPSCPSPPWESLADFLARPAFRRIWIVQELVAASARSRVFCYCGTDSIALLRLQGALQHIIRHGWARALSDFYPGFYESTFYLRTVAIAREEWKHRRLHIYPLFLETRRFEASDARDKVFACIGLLNDYAHRGAHDLIFDEGLLGKIWKQLIDVYERKSELILETSDTRLNPELMGASEDILTIFANHKFNQNEGIKILEWGAPAVLTLREQFINLFFKSLVFTAKAIALSIRTNDADDGDKPEMPVAPAGLEPFQSIDELEYGFKDLEEVMFKIEETLDNRSGLDVNSTILCVDRYATLLLDEWCDRLLTVLFGVISERKDLSRLAKDLVEMATNLLRRLHSRQSVLKYDEVTFGEKGFRESLEELTESEGTGTTSIEDGRELQIVAKDSSKAKDPNTAKEYLTIDKEDSEELRSDKIEILSEFATRVSIAAQNGYESDQEDEDSNEDQSDQGDRRSDEREICDSRLTQEDSKSSERRDSLQSSDTDGGPGDSYPNPAQEDSRNPGKRGSPDESDAENGSNDDDSSSVQEYLGSAEARILAAVANDVDSDSSSENFYMGDSDGGGLCMPKSVLRNLGKVPSERPSTTTVPITPWSCDPSAMKIPDYRFSVKEVYQQFTVQWATNSKSLDFLSTVHPDVERKFEELPSWVPDYSVSKELNPLQHRWFMSRWQPYAAAEETEACVEWSEHRPQELKISGYRVGTITRVTPIAGELSSLENFEVPLEAPYPNEKFTTSEALWRTMVLDTDDEPNPAEASLYGAIAVSLIKGWRPDDPPELPEQLKKDFVEADLESVNSDLTVFLRWVRSSLSERSLFCAESGHLGAAPLCAQEGDVVVVFRGASVPHLLRPDESIKGKWRYVGETFMHGIMDGEILENDPTLEEFCLV